MAPFHQFQLQQSSDDDVSVENETIGDNNEAFSDDDLPADIDTSDPFFLREDTDKKKKGVKGNILPIERVGTICFRILVLNQNIYWTKSSFKNYLV